MSRITAFATVALTALAGCGGATASATGHPRAGAAGTSATRSVTFFSPALHRRRTYLVHLPAGYTSRRRYPVLYLLHSAVGWPERWISAGHVDAPPTPPSAPAACAR